MSSKLSAFKIVVCASLISLAPQAGALARSDPLKCGGGPNSDFLPACDSGGANGGGAGRNMPALSSKEDKRIAILEKKALTECNKKKTAALRQACRDNLP